jgi:hypothetical protein
MGSSFCCFVCYTKGESEVGLDTLFECSMSLYVLVQMALTGCACFCTNYAPYVCTYIYMTRTMMRCCCPQLLSPHSRHHYRPILGVLVLYACQLCPCTRPPGTIFVSVNSVVVKRERRQEKLNNSTQRQIQ